MWRSIPRRSFRRLSGAVAASAASLCVAGCIYGFAGGTLPNVKTVAILPFDNDTPEPALTQEVSDAVRQAFEGRLGLRVAPEATADAIVRGRIVRYDPDLPVSILPGWLQHAAWALPSTYVFEGMRAVLFSGGFRADYLIAAFVLDLVYLGLGAAVFFLAFHNARRRGALLQMGE